MLTFVNGLDHRWGGDHIATLEGVILDHSGEGGGLVIAHADVLSVQGGEAIGVGVLPLADEDVLVGTSTRDDGFMSTIGQGGHVVTGGGQGELGEDGVSGGGLAISTREGATDPICTGLEGRGSSPNLSRSCH